MIHVIRVESIFKKVTRKSSIYVLSKAKKPKYEKILNAWNEYVYVLRFFSRDLHMKQKMKPLDDGGLLFCWRVRRPRKVKVLTQKTFFLSHNFVQVFHFLNFLTMTMIYNTWKKGDLMWGASSGRKVLLLLGDCTNLS